MYTMVMRGEATYMYKEGLPVRGMYSVTHALLLGRA